VNIEGKEFVFEPNSPDIYQGGYSNTSQDPNGRPIRVKVVRNTAAFNLKPGRVAHFDESSSGDVDTGETSRKLETGVDGYCIAVADQPAGVVDEFLPAGGVVANDLFYIVVDGPTLFTNQTSPITTAVGSILVPQALGTTRGDDLGGRVALQSLVFDSSTTTSSTAAALALSYNIQNRVGKAEVINTASNAQFAGVIHRAYR